MQDNGSSRRNVIGAGVAGIAAVVFGLLPEGRNLIRNLFRIGGDAGPIVDDGFRAPLRTNPNPIDNFVPPVVPAQQWDTVATGLDDQLDAAAPAVEAEMEMGGWSFYRERAKVVICEAMKQGLESGELPSKEDVAAGLATDLGFYLDMLGIEAAGVYRTSVRSAWDDVEDASDQGADQAALVGIQRAWCVGLPPYS